MDNILKFSVLTVLAKDGEIGFEEISSVSAYTIGQLIYDYFDGYAMIPFLTEYQEYIFAMLVHLIYNQVLYPENYKKLLIEELLVVISIMI